MEHRTNHSIRHLILLTLLVLCVVAAVAWQAPHPTVAGSGITVENPVYLPIIAKPKVPNTTTTPTTISTPTRTSTPTPTATATSTATTTPTRDCSGVYPIAIKTQLLDANGFLPPTNQAEAQYYVQYSDATYQNKWQRRLYLDAVAESSFNFLRWLAPPSSGNAAALTAALTSTGTLDQGFDEVVPWPDPNGSAPAGYPSRPHRLNAGDWMYGLDGVSTTTGMRAALDYHIQHRTVMVFPITDLPVGVGLNTSWHMLRFGNFLLNGYGGSGSSFYFDLVYVGEPSPTPCTS